MIGDLNSRRGRPLGMEPVGAGMTEIKAEVPMAEMLSYAPDLRSITGGQGEFTMEFLRYEEVPGHLAGEGRGRGARGEGGRQGVGAHRRGPPPGALCRFPASSAKVLAGGTLIVRYPRRR